MTHFIVASWPGLTLTERKKLFHNCHDNIVGPTLIIPEVLINFTESIDEDTFDCPLKKTGY